MIVIISIDSDYSVLSLYIYTTLILIVLTEFNVVFRWLRGEEFDVRDEFDKYARQENDDGESSSDEVSMKTKDQSESKYD